MFLWGLALHLIMLIVNYIGALLIRVSIAVRKTLVILASTKTLAITLSVISFLPPEVGDAGLMSLTPHCFAFGFTFNRLHLGRSLEH